MHLKHRVKMGNHWEGGWVCAKRPGILRTCYHLSMLLPQGEASFSPLLSLTPSERHQGQDEGMGMKSQSYKPGQCKRDKPGIERKAEWRYVPFPFQSSGVIRLSVGPEEGWMKRLARKHKSLPLCTWELVLCLRAIGFKRVEESAWVREEKMEICLLYYFGSLTLGKERRPRYF